MNCNLDDFDGSDNNHLDGCVFTFTSLDEPVEPVPSLSQWGIVILGFVLLIVGTGIVIQSKVAPL